MKQKTILRRMIIIIAAIVLSGTMAIEVKNSLTTHFSHEISILGTFLFWVTALALLIGIERLQILFGKYENFFKSFLLVFSVLLVGLGCWVVYLDLSQ
jgi:hypothetical protein